MSASSRIVNSKHAISRPSGPLGVRTTRRGKPSKQKGGSNGQAVSAFAAAVATACLGRGSLGRRIAAVGGQRVGLCSRASAPWREAPRRVQREAARLSSCSCCWGKAPPDSESATGSCCRGQAARRAECIGGGWALECKGAIAGNPGTGPVGDVAVAVGKAPGVEAFPAVASTSAHDASRGANAQLLSLPAK
eukprot:1158101-Pelagomonas_calceolata.AAC.8